jgi:polar amino acid transport system ATP-binding protein
MNADGSLVRLDDVHKRFGEDLDVLRAIDLSVAPGEVLVVIGPSGSGKSTLLRTINLLEEPTEDRVLFDGVELTDIRTNLDRVRTEIGIVFQQFNPSRTRRFCRTPRLRSRRCSA